MDARCEVCAYWLHTGVNEGICRRYPPSPFPIMGPRGPVGCVANQPPVKAAGWCAEFEPQNFLDKGDTVH